jgi:Xaa-Pro aminopeptidase
MTYPTNLTDARRRRLLTLLEADVALIPSSSFEAFGTFSFRQDSDFYYLTGSEIPNSWLVLDSYQESATMYIPRRDERFYRKGRENAFPGRIFDEKEVSDVTGMDIEPVAKLRKDLGGRKKIWMNFGSQWGTNKVQRNLNFDNFFSYTRWSKVAHYTMLKKLLPDAEFGNLYHKIASLRMIKDSYEIKKMRESVKLSAEGICKAIKEVKPGITERHLTSVIVAEYLNGGAQRLPLAPIVKSGENSTRPWPILGATYNRRNRVIDEGDIVIADVGAELDYYIGDVARTFPASGRFTERQKQVYGDLLFSWERAIQAIKPGVSIKQIENATIEGLDKSLLPWWDPVIGHFIGLDAFDTGSLNHPLKVGMTITIEPRIYIREENLEVMIEDNVLVTDNGPEILSNSVPRDIEEIEETMNS